MIRENAARKTIHLINITNNSEDYWNLGKNTPTPQQHLRVRILLELGVKAVYMASPDQNHGRPQNLPYEITDSLRGKTLEVTIPNLAIWTVLCVDLQN